MWMMKNCPRCGGDMFIERDSYGWYEKCLQCGYCGESKGLDKLGHGSAREDKRPVGALGHETRGK